MGRQHIHIEPSTCYTTLTPAVTGLALKKEEETTDLRTQHFGNPKKKVCGDNFPLRVKKRKDTGRKVIEPRCAYFAKSLSSTAESKCHLTNLIIFFFNFLLIKLVD